MITVPNEIKELLLTPVPDKVDWRWRKLFNIVSTAYPNRKDIRETRTALWRTSCILRAKMRTDKSFTNL